MDAEDKGDFAAVHMLGDRFVGGQHEFFNNRLGDRAGTFFNRNRHALVIQLDFQFRQVKVDRAAAESFLSQGGGEGFHFFQHRHERRILRLQGSILVGQNPPDDRIAEPGADADHAGEQFILDDSAAAVDIHFGRERQPVLALIEAADAVGQAVRQHRDDPVHQIDTGAALARFLIERTVFPHIVADIGNMYAKPEQAGADLFDMYGIIKVFGVFPVDGYNGEFAQITPSGQFIRLDRCSNFIRFLRRCRRKIGWQLMHRHDGQHIDARLTQLAKDLRDTALGFFLLFGPAGEFYHDLIAGARCGKGFFGDDDFGGQFAVGWLYQTQAARIDAERADDMRIGALQNFYDFAFGFAAIGELPLLQADLDGVAMHRIQHFFTRDIDIGHRLVGRNDKAKAFAGHLQLPFQEFVGRFCCCFHAGSMMKTLAVPCAVTVPSGSSIVPSVSYRRPRPLVMRPLSSSGTPIGVGLLKRTSSRPVTAFMPLA